MMRPLFRPDPVLPVGAMQTYEATAQTKPATCQDVDCQDRARGWRTVLDLGTDHGRRAANYIRLKSGRKFTFSQDGDRLTFVFPAGQKCFKQHEQPIGAIYLKWGGDWRATTTDKVRMREVDWIDDQANRLIDISEVRKRG